MIVIVHNGEYEDRETYYVDATSLSEVTEIVQEHNLRREAACGWEVRAEIMGTCDRINWVTPPRTAMSLAEFKAVAARHFGL